MQHKVLITGSTDGIGKELALALAQQHYQIHLLGRDASKGIMTLKQINEIYPNKGHKFYQADLSSIEGNNRFLNNYINNNDKLDLLVLNANIYPKKSSLNTDGIDTIFMISYLSRYIFSSKLAYLLHNTRNPRILHIGGATYIKKKIDFSKITTDNNKTFDATGYGFLACNLLVYFANKLGFSSIPIEFYEPGIVNTNTVKSQSSFIQRLSKLMGMIEPIVAGENICKHIVTTNSQKVAGKFYNMKGEKKPKEVVSNGRDMFDKLMDYSYKMTGYKL